MSGEVAFDFCIQDIQSETLFLFDSPSEGCLKSSSEQYTVTFYKKTEAESKEVLRHLKEINDTKSLDPKMKQEISFLNPKMESHLSHETTHFTSFQNSDNKNNAESFCNKSPTQTLNTHARLFSSQASTSSQNTQVILLTLVNKIRTYLTSHFTGNRKEISTKRESPIHSFSTLQMQKEPSQVHHKPSKQHQEEQEKKEKDGKQQQHSSDDDECAPTPISQKPKKELSALGMYCSAPYFEGAVSRHYNKPKKPILPAPKESVSIFSSYYLLDKLSLISESKSFASDKEDISQTHQEADALHKARLEEIEKSIKKEKSSQRWGVMVKFFSWMASMTGLMAGVALIASGVGVVAGSLLLVGGVFSVSNEIMELTGAWKKIGEILPGDDPERKRAVITWMQIGISVLCLILSGAGLVFGGFSSLSQGMATANAMTTSIFGIGGGISQIGRGVSEFFYYDGISQAKWYELLLVRVKYQQKDLMDKVDNAPDMLESIFKSLNNILKQEKIINRAFQKAW